MGIYSSAFVFFGAPFIEDDDVDYLAFEGECQEFCNLHNLEFHVIGDYEGDPEYFAVVPGTITRRDYCGTKLLKLSLPEEQGEWFLGLCVEDSHLGRPGWYVGLNVQ